MHRLVFDPSSRAGRAIVGLFLVITQEIADGDGWNGGDVVEAVDRWFSRLGFDVPDSVEEAEAQDAAEAAGLPWPPPVEGITLADALAEPPTPGPPFPWPDAS